MAVLGGSLGEMLLGKTLGELLGDHWVSPGHTVTALPQCKDNSGCPCPPHPAQQAQELQTRQGLGAVGEWQPSDRATEACQGGTRHKEPHCWFRGDTALLLPGAGMGTAPWPGRASSTPRV